MALEVVNVFLVILYLSDFDMNLIEAVRFLASIATR